jgi:alanyl-tRNA synthetase
LAYFESLEHLRLASASLVPDGDKSLLLINAGMAPLKRYFMGEATPPAPRAVSCQKCIRTGDIEEVGKTARHATFFEMLGNFSFADYFKKEAIIWAWDFVTKELGMPVDKLYISIYLDDDEAFDIWHNTVGVAKDRIYRMGKEDNFWELSVGPCGPCSEIYFDRGAEYGTSDDFMTSVTAGEDRFLEFWNLVFIQFNKDEEGNYSDLPSKGIDTGMGLERIAMIMQDVPSIFDIDTFVAVKEKISVPLDVAGERIVSDHIRSVAFMLADGIMPGNEGRGYVLRRLLRRAARFERSLPQLAEVVIDNFKGAYPALSEKRENILMQTEREARRFYETLDAGMTLLKSEIARLLTGDVFSGAVAFKLHDTYGFPMELTREILEEEGLELDVEGFHACMEEQRSRARAAREDAGYTGGAGLGLSQLAGLELPPTVFVGYDDLVIDDASVLYVSDSDGSDGDVLIVLDKTPMYAEAGGQKADFGVIKTADGVAEVTNCVAGPDGLSVHFGRILEGSVSSGQTASVQVDSRRRLEITRNHTATHLLHNALMKVLGSHVSQAGASKSPDSLRFDFNHSGPLSKEEIYAVEDMVNFAVMQNLPVCIKEMPLEEAKALGAIALFGEKYDNTVRVVKMGEAVELCGGTHLNFTGSVGSFKIISESGIAAGVRRIEAATGPYALAVYRSFQEQVAEIAHALKTPAANLLSRAEQLAASNREYQKQIEKLRQKDAGDMAGDILASGRVVGGVTLYAAALKDFDMDALRKLSDSLMDRISGDTAAVLLLAGTIGGKGNILARATKAAEASGVHCGNMVKAAAVAAGGGGGGRPNMAQAGISDAALLSKALEAAEAVLV